MSELGLYALTRESYWTVFSSVLAPVAARVTACWWRRLTACSGVPVFARRHLKRMLAFATISHIGLFLIGIALLDAGR
jgi:multicomponent Na+:H+ antiporter subunit D